MTRGHRAQRSALRRAAPGLALVAVVVVVSVLAVATGMLDGSGEESPSTVTASSSGPATSAATPSPSGPSLEQERHQCAVAYRSAQDALESAERTLEQWEIHIGAMNQLVAGEITLAQARDFWARTRVAAAAKADAFRQAYQEYRSTEGCAYPEAVGPGGAGELSQCAEALAADEAALAEAETALTTWEHHIEDMNRLRAGTLSGEKAAAMWQRMWKKGVEQMEDYQQAAAKARGGTCPLA